MAAPRKYDDHTRKRILQLHVHQKKSAADTAKTLELEGTPISVHTVRQIARDERNTEIADKPKTEQLRSLTALAVQVIHDGFSRQQAKSNEADPDDTLKLVRSLRELEPLLSDKPAGNEERKQAGTLGGLSSVPPTPEDATHPKSAAVRSLRT